MNTPLRRGIALLAVALAMICPRGSLARGPRQVPFPEDTHVFRRILFDFKLRPLNGTGPIEDPADTILVVFGDTNWMQARGQRPGWVRRFVEQGGALLFATDQPPSDGVERELLEVAGVKIAGEPYHSQTACYRGLDYCPILLPVPEARPELFRDPQAGGASVLRVATNLPTYLVRRGPPPGDIVPLAALPPNAVAFGRLQFRSFSPVLFAVGGERDNGKVLVLGDHSIFINEMMMPADNNNVEFAYNCIDWLRAKADGGKRRQVLFVQDGEPRTDLDVPLRNVSIDPGDVLNALAAHRNELAAGVEQELARLEDRNALNEGLMGALADMGLSEDRLEQWAVVVLSLLLVSLGGYAVMTRGRHRAESAVLPLARAVALHVPTAPLLEQRHQALLRGGNVWEAARGLARQWFASAGAAEQKPPRVVSEGGWWERWVLRRRVRRLWRLAYDPRPVRVSLRALRRLLGELEDMSVALANGSLRLEA